MNFPFIKSLTLRVTTISLLVFYGVMAVFFWIQYQVYVSQLSQEFSERIYLHFDSLSKNKVLSEENAAKNLNEENIFSPFDASGNNLWEAIIIDKETNEILVNEYLYIDEKNSEIIKNLKANVLTHVTINQNAYSMYRFDYQKYAIIYAQNVGTIWTYYYGILDSWKIIALWSVIIFFGMSLYFSRLVVRPIREQNNSLALYNTNLAHELKTPLAVVRSNLEMLELTKNEKFIESSREELEHLEKIINALLFLTKKDLSHENFIEVDLVVIIKKLLRKFWKLHTNIHFDGEKICKKVEPNLLAMLLQNIFENSYKYSVDQNIHIIWNEKYIIFSNKIAKNFTRKELERIQELFYQADVSRSTSGYGIGISMINRIAEIFGWETQFSCEDNIFSLKIIF